MKKRLLSTLTIAIFVTTMAVASAQAQNAANVTVTVPFDFVVAGKTLPAGDYLLRMEGSRSTMKIQKRDSSTAAFVMVSPLDRRDIQNQSKLVFNRYGSQHFLAQVWIAGRSKGEELRKSTEERAIRSELAALKRRPETVTIAVRSN